MENARTQPSGMTGFTLIWLGQVASLLGTYMTQFGLSIWAWEKTGQATALAMVAFFNFAPRVLLSPVAGALVDRWNRKLVMMLSDLMAGLCTVAILILYLSGVLEIWHLYVAGAITGAFQAFQFPAYSAAITLMLSKDDYARANGMLALAESLPDIAAPILAGILIVVIGIGGIMAIDVTTFILALAVLLVVAIPQPPLSEAGREGTGSLLSESVYGFRFIFARPSLLSLQLVFFAANFTFMVNFGILAPMILSRTGSDQVALGAVQSAAGVGGVAGGLLMGTWGGPKRRVLGVVLGMIASSVLGQALMGVGHGLPVWIIAAFLTIFFIPIMDGCNQAIWQSKVPPDVQGRVFGARLLIGQMTAPLALLIAGPLADRVFEPGIRSGVGLWGALVPLFGTFPGGGMSAMTVLFATLGLCAGLVALANPIVRNVETILPDHGQHAVETP